MIDGDDLELLARSIRHAAASHAGAALDAALVEVGWRDALAVDPRAAVALHFEAQGRATTTSSALDQLIVAACGVEADAVVLPAPGRWTPPVESSGDRWVVRGIGGGALRDAALRDAARVLVVARDGDGAVARCVAGSELAAVPVEGIDPDLGLVTVAGELRRGDARAVDWPAAVDRARLALAHELVGLSATMLDQAREHALDRVQFGQPIAAFQAVRHRLADALVAIETAAAMLDAAWIEPSPQTAAMAKAVAGRSARTVARHSQQVLAGIGFTVEHPFHRSLRRVLVLDELFGSSRTLTAALGADVLAGGLPPLLAL